MKFLFILFFAASLGLTTNSEAQRIKLTNSNTGKEVILTKGIRVIYSLKTNIAGVVGSVTEITATSLTVDSTNVAYEDLGRLGKRKKGSGFGAFTMAFLGGAFIGSVIFADNSDPCPQCTTVSVEDEGGTAGNVLAVTGGLALIGLSVNTAIKNSPRDLSVWKLEVIE